MTHLEHILLFCQVAVLLWPLQLCKFGVEYLMRHIPFALLYSDRSKVQDKSVGPAIYIYTGIWFYRKSHSLKCAAVMIHLKLYSSIQNYFAEKSWHSYNLTGRDLSGFLIYRTKNKSVSKYRNQVCL